MKLNSLASIVLVGMVAIPVVAVAEPDSGAVAQNQSIEQVRVENKKEMQNQIDTQQEIWGDPEESEENESPWTWFGMGYEQRNSLIKSSGGDPSSGQGEGAPSYGGGMGRNKGASGH